jgi:hypothetical protein
LSETQVAVFHGFLLWLFAKIFLLPAS